MNILVTGATGFIGRQLTLKILEAGHVPTLAVRQYDNSLLSGIKQIEIGDLADLPSANNITLLEALKNIDVVIHSAARVHVMKDNVADPLDDYRLINVDATMKLANLAAEAGVKRFVFFSTVKVNGEENRSLSIQTELSHTDFVHDAVDEKYGAAFRETDKPEPQDPYAISKWEAEEGLKKIAAETGLEVVIVRPPLVYGPGVKGNFAALLRWIRNGVPLPLGAVHNQRSFIALDNLVDFVVLTCHHPAAADQTFLIADSEDVSTSELLKKIAKACGKKPHLLPIPVSWMSFVARILGKQAVAERLFGSLQVDISKARGVLGWQPVVTMDKQLEKIVSEQEEI